MHSPNVSENPSTSDVEPQGGTATLTGAKQTIVNAARETAAEIKHSASSSITRAKEEAARLAADKKAQTADRIGNYGSAIHDSAKSLEEKDPNIAWLTHRAADRLESVADYVRTRDFGALRSDAENLARRHPVAFFGGLFLAGLVLGNVLKASNRGPAANGSTDDDDGNGSEGYGAPSQRYAQNDPRTASDLGLESEASI